MARTPTWLVSFPAATLSPRHGKANVPAALDREEIC